MKRHARIAGSITLIAGLLLAAPTPGDARGGGGGHGGSFHGGGAFYGRSPGMMAHRHPGFVGHRGSRAFVDGFFFFDPFFFPYYGPYPAYGYPPPPEDWGEPPPQGEGKAAESSPPA